MNDAFPAPTIAAVPPRHRRIFGPYSRRLRRGAVGDLCDGRSALGRFIRDLESQLVAHVGGAPSIAERLIIERVIRLRLQLDALDTKLAAGDWTPHDGRTYGGILNAYRLCLRELGLKAPEPKPPSLDEIFAAAEARRAAAAEAEAEASKP